MKKIVYFLSGWCVMFCLLVGWYFLSQDFRFFVKSIKHTDGTFSTQPPISDQHQLSTQCNVLEYEQQIQLLKEEIAFLKGTTKPISEIVTQSGALVLTGMTQSWALALTGSQKPVDAAKVVGSVLKFFPTYSFEEKPYDEYFQIFGITDEFPQKYVTYTTQSFESYFFLESNYDEIYNFFEVVSYDLPITLNKTNSFGERSFFINTKTKDDYVRLVIQFEKKVFGLKIKNNYYNTIKQTLEKF